MNTAIERGCLPRAKPLPRQLTMQLPQFPRVDTSRPAGVANSSVLASVLDEITLIVEDPDVASRTNPRSREIVHQLVDEIRFPITEQIWWLRYLASMNERIAAGEISEDQRKTFLTIWRRAREQFPRLRRPSMGGTDDGRLHASWTFADLPGLSFTLDIERDGRVEWFYRNASEQHVCGTEDEPEVTLTDDALSLLASFQS